MATKPSQQQSSTAGRIRRAPSVRPDPFLQQIQGKRALQEDLQPCKELGVDERRDEDKELQEHDGSILEAELERPENRKEGFPAYTQSQLETPFLHIHEQVDMQSPASAGHLLKDPEVLIPSSMATMPSNADRFGCMDATKPFGGFPSKQVEGALQSCLTSAEDQMARLLQQAMDTVQSQVLRALHQAASDIIQHVGKEAAHRVVVVEHKVALLELELSSVKQQALSMLLRLKADSDAQALDADKKYLFERRRAQDAEAKLAVAHDNSKRLRAELNRREDIIDKMQKLVQPVNNNNSQNPSISMELTGHLESCVRGNNKLRVRKSPVCSVDGTSFIMCSTGAHHKEVNCADKQLGIEANVQVMDDCTEKQNSLSSKVPAAEEDSIELQNQGCLSNGTLQNNTGSPKFPEEDSLMKKTNDKKGDLCFDNQVELSGYVDGSLKISSLHANVDGDVKPIEDIDNMQHHSLSESTDKKVNLLSGFEKIVGGKNVTPGSSTAVKGFYVRRKVRDNVKMQDKKGIFTADKKNCLNAILEDDMKTEVLIRSFSETESQLESDLSERELQNFSSRRDSQALSNVTNSSSLLGHATQSLAECHRDVATDLPEEICSSECAKTVDLCSNRTRAGSSFETVELARPDYEVATSLAELASLGLSVRSQEMELLPCIKSKEGIFLKPGKTGLRMKRKGISFERKMKMSLEGRVNKKPRPDTLLSSLTESHAERALRKNRGRKYSLLKDSLSLESSRDNRRLVQGARQVQFHLWL